MKKGMKIALGILGLIIFVGLIGRLGWYETHTIRYGSIIKVEADEVLFEDADGYIWAFEGKGFEVNDIVEVPFWNATTKTILDDEIEVNNIKILKR